MILGILVLLFKNGTHHICPYFVVHGKSHGQTWGHWAGMCSFPEGGGAANIVNKNAIYQPTVGNTTKHY